MAKIRVKCPACKSELEVDESYEGQKVECGHCLEVFSANREDETSSGGRRGGRSSRGKRSSDDDDRPRRKRRRQDDDEDYDDSEDYYSPPRRRSGSGNGLAIASLILGITSIVPGACTCLFIPLGPAAIITGVIGMKNTEGKGMATAGLVLGICGLVLGILVLVARVGLFVNAVNRLR